MNVRLVHAIIFGLNQKAFTYFLGDIHKLHYLKGLRYKMNIIWCHFQCLAGAKEEGKSKIGNMYVSFMDSSLIGSG